MSAGAAGDVSDSRLRTGPPPCPACVAGPPFALGEKVQRKYLSWFQRMTSSKTKGPFIVLRTHAIHDHEEGHIELIWTDEPGAYGGRDAGCYEKADR